MCWQSFHKRVCKLLALRMSNKRKALYPIGRDVEQVNFCGNGGWMWQMATASTLAFHIKRQKLKCRAIFCKIYDEHYFIVQ